MHVLVAVDLRDPIEPLIAQAQQWVEQLGATVDLVFIESQFDSLKLVRDPAVRELMAAEAESLLKSDRKKLQSLLKEFPLERRGVIRVENGSPADTILRLAPEYDAVIVGTHGRTGLAHLWLGSQAERVVRNCPRPVLVLRLGNQ